MQFYLAGNMKTSPKVSIIILNWNAAGDTIRCIDSFLKVQYDNYEIVVVDNGSEDGSYQLIKRKYPDIVLIETGENLGYAAGNNAGIKYAIQNGADYILLVNNDTKLLNPQFLKQAVELIMEADCKIGIIGPKVFTSTGQVQDTILFTPTLLNCIKQSFRLRWRIKESKDYSKVQEVDAVSGVCLLIKKELIDEIGLLDEDYFMYAEEQDYCYRAQRAGWKVIYYPVDSIIHYRESVSSLERYMKRYIYVRKSLIIFLRKHYGFLYAIILSGLFLISNLCKALTAKGEERQFYNFSFLSSLYKGIKDALRSGKSRA